MTTADAKPPRIGHRMRELQAIVSAMPGISKSDALRAAGLPLRGPGTGRELNRAIAAGLIIVEHERVNLCRLFASERDRRRWQLVRALLAPGTPAGRECVGSGRMATVTEPGDSYRWRPGDDILGRIDAVLAQR